MNNVVIVGFGKSATTTIHKALSKSGYDSHHQNVKRLGTTVPELMYDSYERTGDPYSAFGDWSPFALTQLDYTNPTKGRVMWPQLDYDMMVDGFEKNESVVYVLNYREPRSLVDSFLRWKDGGFHDRIVRANLPGLPSGVGRDEETLIEWVTNHFDRCRDLFGSSTRFIEVDIESESFQQDLEEFLGMRFNWWGVANKNV